MSLLADLLSKNKSGSAKDGGETPPPLNVPPTLSKAHGIPSNVRKLNSRYIIVAVACVIFVALGTFLTSKSGLLRSTAQKKMPLPPQVAPQPVLIKPESPSTAPPQITPAPPSPEQPAKARITLGEPAEPEPQKKVARRHNTKRVICPPVKVAVAPPPAQKIDKPPPQVAAKPSQKPVAPRKIDTAARDSLLYSARSAEQVSDWKTALFNYRRAVEIDPDNYKILSNLAAVLNNLGMFDDSIREAERALGKKPDYVPALINAAIGHSSRGNVQKALRYFTYASAMDPNNSNLIINLGILHERSGNYDDALATYRQLAAAGDPLALEGMGRSYEHKGNKAEAIRVYRQIMALSNASLVMKKEVKGKISRLEE